jgi:TonB family protein
MAAKIYGWVLALFVTLSWPLCMTGGSQPPDRVALEAKLQKVLQGKVAVLRTFYTSDELNFDSQGNLKGLSRIGPWTFYGRVEIDSVQLTDNSLIIKAKRNVVKWEESASEFTNYTLNHAAHITIDLAPGYDEATLAATIDKVFLSRQQRLSDIVPDYWKELLTTERNRRAKQDQEKAQIMKDVEAVGQGISQPRLQSSSQGIQISRATFTDLTANTLALSFIVDEKGDVRNVQIEKPVGLGKDDEIATIIKKWKFNPAMKDGKPVPVVMYAKRVFFPGRDRDPYHSLPCPDPVQFDC